MLEILKAIILGIIEGFTEFLPISSTGHLIVGADVLQYKDTAEIFTVVCQMGAIAAVIWFYRQDLIKKVVGLLNRDPETVRFWVVWVIATIPAGLAGLLFKDLISKYAVVATVGITLIVGGILIWLIETYHTPATNTSGKAKIEKLTINQALRIGAFQMLALVPGVSRSGSTIMGALLSGVDRVTATAFSFYLSIPIILVAGSYQLVKGRNDFDTVAGGIPALIIGTVVAFVTALIAISWLLKYVSRNDFKLFAYYRVILGVIILLAIA